MIPDYIAALKVQGSDDKAKLIPIIVEDLIAVLKQYPISRENFQENEDLIQIES